MEGPVRRCNMANGSVSGSNEQLHQSKFPIPDGGFPMADSRWRIPDGGWRIGGDGRGGGGGRLIQIPAGIGLKKTMEVS